MRSLRRTDHPPEIEKSKRALDFYFFLSDMLKFLNIT